MKTAPFLAALSLCIAYTAALDCYQCSLYEGANDVTDDYIAANTFGFGTGGGDVGCDDPMNSDNDANGNYQSLLNVTCATGESCQHTVSTYKGTYSTADETVKFKVYSRGCSETTDTADNCGLDSVQQASALAYFLTVNITVEESGTSLGDECYCNDQNFCNSDKNSGAVGVISLLAVAMAVAAKFA